MQTILVLKGAPAAGKGFYCRELMNKEPNKWKRINNDTLRDSIDLGEYSFENEKIIRNVRSFLIKEFLTKGYNILHDNVNATSRNFEDICKVVSTLNLDVQVVEKSFYIELDEAIRRDSLREGKTKVGEAIVRKWHKELGGSSFKHYKSKVKIFTKHDTTDHVTPMIQDESLPKTYLVDLDGTVADISHRTSPYAANECLNDKPIKSVIDTVLSLYKVNHKIIFMSGRSEEFRDLSKQWIDTHIKNNELLINYELFMRPINDNRPDQIIKRELFDKNIKDKYFVVAVFDDRPKVIKMWREKLGLTVFQLNDIEF